MGFFVRFGSINKRQGDLLHTTDGRELVLGSIALAEERRPMRNMPQPLHYA